MDWAIDIADDGGKPSFSVSRGPQGGDNGSTRSQIGSFLETDLMAYSIISPWRRKAFPQSEIPFDFLPELEGHEDKWNIQGELSHFSQIWAGRGVDLNLIENEKWFVVPS